MIMMMNNDNVEHVQQQQQNNNNNNSNNNDNTTTTIIIEQQQQQQQLQQNTNHDNEDDDENENIHNNESNIYWVDDQWTDEDCMMAQEQLNEYASKCRIDDETAAIGSISTKKKRKKFTKKYNHYLSKNKQHNNNNMNNNNDNYHAWNQFYIGNTNKFFKDRHYLSIDFPNEFNYEKQQQRKIISEEMTNHNRCFIEMGCGVGNTLLPLLEMKKNKNNKNEDEDEDEIMAVDDNFVNNIQDKNIHDHYYPWLFTHLYGFDISPVAIDILKQDVRYQTYSMKTTTTTISKSNHDNYDTNNDNHICDDNNNHDNDIDQSKSSILPPPQIYVDVCDISIPYSTSYQYNNIANVVSLLFCLSAIDPTNHINTIQNVIRTLKSPTPIINENDNNNNNNNNTEYHDDGGIIIFRDYGRYDEAQMKLSRQNQKLLPTTVNTSTIVSTPSSKTTKVDGDDHHHLKDDDQIDNDVDDDDDNHHHHHSESASASIQNDNNNDTNTYSHFYIKNDGTKCYYFTIEDLITIFHIHGKLKVLECQYIYRTYYNRSLKLSRRRVWIQGRFQKVITP